MNHWAATGGVSKFQKLVAMNISIDNNGTFSSNSTLGNKFSPTENVFVYQAYKYFLFDLKLVCPLNASVNVSYELRSADTANFDTWI